MAGRVFSSFPGISRPSWHLKKQQKLNVVLILYGLVQEGERCVFLGGPDAAQTQHLCRAWVNSPLGTAGPGTSTHLECHLSPKSCPCDRGHSLHCPLCSPSAMAGRNVPVTGRPAGTATSPLCAVVAPFPHQPCWHPQPARKNCPSVSAPLKGSRLPKGVGTDPYPCPWSWGGLDLP